MRPWQELTYATVGLAERVSTFADEWAYSSQQHANEVEAFEADSWVFDEDPHQLDDGGSFA